MRRVSKPWPPGDVYPNGHEPSNLPNAEKTFVAALPEAPDRAAFARFEFDRLEKRKLRAEMYREQHSLCVYCERQLVEGDPTPRIDHWRPLSLEPGLALHWKNLYLSCPSPETCDSAKGDRAFRWNENDPHLPWPTDLQYEDIVSFTSFGEVYVRSDVNLSDDTRRALQLAMADCLDGKRTRRGILNLNHPALVAARAAALDSERRRLQNDYAGQRASSEEREHRATELLAQEPRPAFVSIRVAWLRNRLGRGR